MAPMLTSLPKKSSAMDCLIVVSILPPLPNSRIAISKPIALAMTPTIKPIKISFLII